MRKATGKLDAIIILGTPVEKDLIDNTRRAVEVGERIGTRIYVGTGVAVDLPGECRSQAQVAGSELKRLGIEEGRIILEGGSRNTVENLLYSLGMIDGTEIGLCSNPRHLDRTGVIIGRGRRGGVISRDLNFYRIDANLRFLESVYESWAAFMARFSVQDDLSQRPVFWGAPGKLKKYAFVAIDR